MDNKLNGVKYMEHVLNNIDTSIYIVDKDRNVIYVNRLAESRIFCGKDLLNQSMYTVFPSLDKEESSIEYVFSTGQPITDKVWTWIDNRGDEKISLISTFPIISNNEIMAVCEASEPLDSLNHESRMILHQKMPRISKMLGDEIKKSLPYYTVDDILGNSRAMKELRNEIRMISKSPANILIYGETGTGKEMVAQSVHSMSRRNNSPFVAQNCAAIPETLLESSLFGTYKGSFTGAETRPGLFELANNGILFLDEINSMPINLQAKILRTLQENKVRRVGGLDEISVRFRLITATNTHPTILLRDKLIRHDLFYRINILFVEIPPLRSRKDDIPLLIDRFVEEMNDRYGKMVTGFDQRTMDCFMEYSWPGNVRELKNVVERAVCMASSRIIPFDTKVIFPYSQGRLNDQSEMLNFDENKEKLTLKQSVEKLESDAIKKAIFRNRGNLAAASRELDIPQQTMQNKIAKYNLRGFVIKSKLDA